MEFDVIKSDMNQKYESVIKQIRGVIAARVALDKDDNFEEIHILSNTERNPKQIVRDVETVIMVAFGVAIDHKIVSVVQMAEENLNLNEDNWRPCLQSINTAVSKQRTEITVKITMQDTVVEGNAYGPNSPLNKMRMVSVAVLDALEKYFEGKITLTVDEIAKMKFAGQEFVAVSVFLVSPIMQESFLGSAFIKGDEREAVGKATLAAVNRKLSLFAE